ncbi:phytochrome-like protein [Lindgomyces ingoldianus]|uniref:Phytochrome-like protein n=1 Tax=Lindgomyces ingoldianus TaxID=673940 RepID=A0ACB6QK01_9PLEO|nr:phytochrome-like protein [Lindgomyces ingoldianus]KAF2467268.1 phytochrome-like protein [Lindgomyces ingoldianus]
MERVFPIRCTIIDDSPHLLGDHQQQGAYLCEPPPALHTFWCRDSLAYIMSRIIESEEILQNPPQESSQLVHTEHCEHAFINEDGYGFITGKRDTFTRCEDERIRTPGAVQSHGMLIGLEVFEGAAITRCLCRVVSENSEAICKYTPGEIFGLDNFLFVFPAHQRLIFQSYARSVINSFKNTSQSAEPKVFSISFMDPGGYIVPAWCAMHFVGGQHNLLICEFELEESCCINQTLEDDLPSTPYNTLGSDPGEATSSFLKKSEPLNITVHTIDMFQGEGRTMEVVSVMSHIQQQLSSKNDIQDLLDTIVGLIQELTGYHRCMVYRFDENYNGRVVSELLNPQASLDIYKGLHFPASDIPKQARDLYKINKVRVLFNRDTFPSRLVYRNLEDLDSPLDLTHSYLRAMSPVHLKYLANMGVRSTMSVSLDYRNELWGLICCHSYGPNGVRVPFPVRELCYWVGLCASNCLDKVLNAEKIKARNILTTMQIDITPRGCISASSEDLLHMFGADFGFLVVQGEARTIGKLSSYLEAVTLLRYVYFRKFDNTFATKNITRDFSDLVYEPGFDHIAGLLFIPLSQEAGDFVIFFRKNQTKVFHWAGNPNMSKTGSLEPRNSFNKWTETVRGTCSPWTEEQFEAAVITRLVYGNFIRVWREKEAALQETRMKRLLLLNLSHEVRTPLNAVVNYLEMALEKPLNKATKDILTQSYSASRSLIYVIDDLLHLTGGGKQPSPPLVHVAFDLAQGIQLTLDQFEQHAIQKGLTFDIIKDLNFPHYVYGDLQRLQQAVASLVTNAVKNTNKGGIVIHLGLPSATEESCVIQIAVQDTGKGISERELDDLFQEFEQVPDEEPDSDQSPVEEKKEEPKKPIKEARLGLGLALLARYIKHCGGQIRGKSKVGKGSIFSLDVPMQLANETSIKSASRSSASTTPSDDRPEQNRITPQRPTLTSMTFTSSPANFHLHLDRSSRQSERSPVNSIHFHHQLPAKETKPLDIMASQEQATPLKENFMILVADDNPVNISLLQRRLKRMGHEVKIGRDGQQCFREFQRYRGEVDFVLMDLNMPLVDGIKSTMMIREIERTEPVNCQILTVPPTSKRTPIFAVSASLNLHSQHSLEAAGFDGWLSKPIDFERLTVILKGTMSTDLRMQTKCEPGDFKAGGWFG